MPTARGKYQELLDPETLAYVEEVERWFPPEILAQSLAEQRETYDAMCRVFHAGYPPQVRAEDVAAPSPDGQIPLRRYMVPAPRSAAVVLFYHGGGFTLGGLDSHDDVCAEICAGTGLEVVSVDYRLAPEHLHPASFLDALAAYRWVKDRGASIILCGDSAGSNLAAAVAHASRGDPRLLGQVLIYPSLGGDTREGSYVEHADAPLLSTADLAWYQNVRTGGAPSKGDPTFSPLDDTDFSRLPPTVIATAQCDPLSDDGKAYAARIKAAGGVARWREEPRLTHSFLRSRRTVHRAQAAFDAIIADIADLAAGNWP
ncbi:MAG: alpha/beta hydrolase [Pseudomonadota bacterium]|nr:alpha/beta hydrolase [Pseudomonadota bacterium]